MLYRHGGLLRSPVSPAVGEHNNIRLETLCIYTNGSGINGHVGAAALAPALQLTSLCTKRIEYMSKSTTSIVYAAKLKRIALAFQIALDAHAITNTPRTCVVFTDN
jgi:hypothetical protein